MKSVLVLNGPNLNLPRVRVPGTDSYLTLDDVEKECLRETEHLGLGLVFRQSNDEGQLIAWIHEAADQVKRAVCIGVVFNPGALAHSSIALNDAIDTADLPLIELQPSNPHRREAFRRRSRIAPAARGVVLGFGSYGYLPAINSLFRASTIPA
jgi:3-dehydroquinate dehydratase-2